MEKEFINNIEKEINEKAIFIIPVYGGCINQSFKITTKSRSYFVKTNTDTNLFLTERKDLDILRSTNTFFIPNILKVSTFKNTNYLIMDFIESANKKNNFWKVFGSTLSNLHRNTNKNHGLDYNNFIGTLKQANTPNKDWVDFFINCRILPQLKLLQKNKSNNIYSYFDKLFKILPNLTPIEEPSLLHGDLWNGNFIINQNGEASIIDPSIYFGNREVDIAMTKLFGGFSDEFYDAYNSNFPLYEGWEERIKIWNLYPLLVHANLFGGNYISQINSILKKFS